MINNIGIKGRLLLLALLPTSLLAFVLGGYFTWLQLHNLKAQLFQRGQMITEQLAPIAAPALLANDVNVLQRIANSALEQTDVRSVNFLNAEHKQVAHAGPNMLTPSPPLDASQLSKSHSTYTTRYLLPIDQSHLSLNINSSAGTEAQLLGWIELELSHQNTQLIGYRSLLTSFLLIAAGLIVTALLAVRLSRTINEPLRLIKQSVAQLKEGHLQTRLPPLGSHELDELASGINRMAQSLQNAQEELQHSVDQATEDVRQNLETIEIQNIELDLARKEALEASRIKSEFLTNMSHEIRTPLNGILGFTHLLQKSDLAPRQQDYLSTIEKSADSLLSIINEILDFSKIEAGKLILEQVPFNLRDLLQETLTILAPAAHEKQLELLSLVYRDTPLMLLGDPLRLKQVLTNLVSNAIKFTHSGSIVIRAMLEDESPDHAQLRISVQDTGIGLSNEDLRELFQAFSQADNSLSRQAGGTGLGLVISKRLIEQMGGEIGVESTPNEGSEFWITLNLPKSHIGDDDLKHSPLLGRRAALLESHALARQALQHQLEDCGLEVTSFESLDELMASVAAVQLSAQPIDIAVLGVSTQTLAPDQLQQRIWEFDQLNCNVLLLCPTTEQGYYHNLLPNAHKQLQAKPACTSKLHRSLSELICPQSQQATSVPISVSRTAKILCVDDNPANLLLVQTLLEDMGAQVAIANNGFEAVTMAAANRYDLIFMDVQMPGMDGRQATEAIRQAELLRGHDQTPIVALTAHALANEKRSLLQSGMDDYLTKPINEHQLAQIVLKWTGLSLRAQRSVPQNHIETPAKLSVLDADEGLRLAAGKTDLAADMLKMLLNGLQDDRLSIQQARLNEEHEALIERVHRLHGATRYCGVPQLREACQRCETLLKQNSPEAIAALDELDAAIQRLEAATQAAV